VHTLPLPEVQTDVNPNTKQEPSPPFKSPHPPMPIRARGSGPETRDSGLGTRDWGGETLTPNPASRPSESPIPNSESRIPNPECPAPGTQHPTPSLSRLTPQQLQFLLRVTPAALQSQREYEVPACVTIAQAILESATPKFGWGSSVLFRIANNPFGIKYAHFGAGGRGLGAGENRSTQQSAPGTLKPGTRDSGSETRDSGLGSRGSGSEALTPNSESQIPNSESQTPNSGCLIPNSEPPTPSTQHPAPSPDPYGHFDAATWEIENGQKKLIIAQFQRFPNLDEAFTAHALLLRGPRYRPAFAVRDDWKKFAERLGPKTSQLDMEHCGYSTNPSYSAELIKLVTLYRLNDPRALQWFATGKDPGVIGTRDSGLGVKDPALGVEGSGLGKEDPESQNPNPGLLPPKPEQSAGRRQ